MNFQNHFCVCTVDWMEKSKQARQWKNHNLIIIAASAHLPLGSKLNVVFHCQLRMLYSSLQDCMNFLCIGLPWVTYWPQLCVCVCVCVCVCTCMPRFWQPMGKLCFQHYDVKTFAIYLTCTTHTDFTTNQKAITSATGSTCCTCEV